MVDVNLDFVNIRENGWQQGSIVSIDNNDISDKNNIPLECGAKYILVSQDCDIVRDFNKEPFVELLCVKPIEQISGSFTKGKNPRILHLDLESTSLECIIYERAYLHKNMLARLQPDAEIIVSDNNLSILIYWLSNRYARVAYPDESNCRLKTYRTDQKILKIIDKLGKNIKGVFVKLHSFDELSPSTDYEMIILFLVDPEHYENEKEMEIIDNCFEQIISLLSGVVGIKLLDSVSKVRCTKDITVHELQQYYKWDVDYLSYDVNNENEETFRPILR